METNKPLLRFWYFPDTLRCLVTLTNDSEYKTENNFEPQFREVDSMGAKMSLYILGIDKLSATWVHKWTIKGFEIAGHPDDTKEADNPTWNRMGSAIITRRKEIVANYGLPMRTNVNHWFVWCGRNCDGGQEFSVEAKLEENHGKNTKIITRTIKGSEYILITVKSGTNHSIVMNYESTLTT